MHFSCRTRIFITILASYLRRCCIRQTSFMISWFNQFIFSKKFVLGFVFCLSWSLASAKSTWFKTFMSESSVWFKRPDNQRRNLTWKNTIGEGIKMFWKYQLTVWLSIHNFYLHFTKVTRKCECFGRIVEPCNSQKYEEI
jgi:hypothetical protein